MSNPRVSIITACYNNRNTISDTVESILAQTYDNIQYIIIDGGSSDGTIKLIKKYKEKFQSEDFEFISEPDKGISDAWNKGLKLADGELIGLLNADDYYDKSAVEEAVAKFDVNTITYGICKFIDSSKQVVKINDLEFNKNNLRQGFGFMHTTCFVPKVIYEKVGVFNPNMKFSMDSEFLVRCYKQGINFQKCDNVTYMRIGGLSDLNRIKSYKYYLSVLKQNGIKTTILDLPKFYIKAKLKFLLKNKVVRRFIIQLHHVLIFFFNLFYNLIPTFFLRRIYLRFIGIKVGQKSYIHPWATFFNFGNLAIGNNSVVNRGCYLDNRRHIKIGNNVSIGHNTKIYTLGHDINDPFFRNKGANVKIDDYVCIFTNVLIMPGVHIKKGAVVYSGAVVTKNVNEYEVVGGNPAKVIGNRSKDLRYNLNHGYWKAL